jgi:type 1 glutamine amidotransferase
VIQHPNNLQTPTSGNQNVQRSQATQDPLQVDRRCYNYGEEGHYANRCPNRRTRANQTATATPTPTSGANSIPVATKQNYAHGRVNHLVVEEAQEVLDVVIGMFSSVTLLRLCCLILEHLILSYLLCMLRSIIYP